MKMKISILFFFGLMVLPIMAQQAVLSSGGNGSGAGGSFSYSVGQLDYISFGNSNMTVETGVQHFLNRETTVNLKLFIEGYYSSAGNMRPVMNNQDFESPLTDVAFITVELHSAVFPFPVLHTTTTLLKTDGTAECKFVAVPAGSYYIAVKHSNCIQTWSAKPQTIGPVTLTYDFSNAQAKAYGDNMVLVEPGIWAFYSGDLNQDELVDAVDYTFWENDSNVFAFGQYPSDLNGDGLVDNTDYSIWEANNNNFVFSAHP